MSKQKRESWSFENEAFFRAVFDSIPAPVFITDDDVRIFFSNSRGQDLIPWYPKLKIKNRCGDLMHCRHAVKNRSDCGATDHCVKCPIRRAVQESHQEKRLVRTKAWMQVMQGDHEQDLFLLVTAAPFEYENFLFVLLTLEDISDLIDLDKANEPLMRKAKEFEEANTVINALLQKNADERVSTQENLMLNITGFLLPLIDKLKQTHMTELQESYLSLIGSKIREITSPLYRTLSGKYFGLTSMEIRVSDLIRTGKTTKEIAELLATSIRAIEFHRHNIRKKMGLSKKKDRLKAVLSKIG